MASPEFSHAIQNVLVRKSRHAVSITASIVLLLLSVFSQAAAYHYPDTHFQHLQALLDQSQPGDSIIVRPGIYQEKIRIEKSITIRAAIDSQNSPQKAVIFQGNQQGHVVEISAENVTLKGLHIRGSGDVISDSDSCIYVQQQASNVALLNNHLSECAFGIWINGTQHVLIEENNITGYQKKLLSDRGNGINMWNVRYALVKNNTIYQTRDGIYLSVTTNSEIIGNRMNKLRFGIHYMYNDNNTVVDNVTCDSTVGIALMFSKNLIITGNTVINNKDHGILFRSIYDSKISNNTSIGNNKGFFLNDSSYNKIANNTIDGNAIGIHVMAGSENNEISLNSFMTNPVQVRYSWRYSQHWNNNYWSDYLGWDFNEDGSGDRVYYASNQMDQLMFRYPQMKMLASSPVIQLLQALESRFPVLRPPSVIDETPSMRPFPASADKKITQRSECS